MNLCPDCSQTTLQCKKCGAPRPGENNSYTAPEIPQQPDWVCAQFWCKHTNKGSSSRCSHSQASVLNIFVQNI